MFTMLARTALVGMLFLPGAAFAAEPADAPLWGVGRLPIECVEAPCQGKGLFPLNPAARAEAGMIWFDQFSPPPMLGPLRLLREIRAAYAAGECLQVSGHFTGERLTVLETLGGC